MSTTVSKNQVTPFPNAGCQCLPQSTRMRLHHGGCQILMSTTVNKNQVTPFPNARCQCLPQSTRMGLQPLLIVLVNVYHNQQEWVYKPNFFFFLIIQSP